MYLEYVFVGGGEEGYSTLDVMEFGGRGGGGSASCSKSPK